MDRFCTISTFSPREVVDTLKSVVYGYAGHDLSEDEKNGCYIMASELLGVSVDALNEEVERTAEREEA